MVVVTDCDLHVGHSAKWKVKALSTDHGVLAWALWTCEGRGLGLNGGH